jgi:energy-converting hydrogenase Eha subunit B
MSAITAALPKYLQARTTANILNAVRILGTLSFGLLALLLVIVGLVQWADAHTNGTLAVLTIIGVLAALVSGALFYATVGWFVDTLSLLTQIAKNTAA